MHYLIARCICAFQASSVQRGRSALSLFQYVKNQFGAARYTQLLIDSEEIIVDSVFGQAEFLGDLTVWQALSYQIGELVLPFGQKATTYGVHDTERLSIDQLLEDKMKLVAVHPYLPVVHDTNALAERFRRIRATENTLDSSPERIDDEITGGRFKQ